jgi:RsiW-degrading membrane proteinase PrsW (M82 family)
LGIVGISIAAILVLIVGVFFVLSLGPVAFAVAGIMAIVPLAIVLLGVNWIDRWEPEPRGILVFAFLWGAGVSVLLALIVGSTVDTVLAVLTGSDGLSEVLGAVVEAPLVEEGAKGLGVLLIFLVARKHFDSPVDGIVYAAWVAGGFAFSENILYFGSQLLDSNGIDASLVGIFVIRGIMSPFAHVMFTACTGIALGIAARRVGILGAIGVFLLGLIPAIGLHALWNGALFLVDNFFGYYALVQFPLFIGGVIVVLYLRRQESRLTFARLNEYAAVGWFSPGEVTSLATGVGRRQAAAWARQHGLGAVMKRYTRDATRLAFTRQRLVTGRAATGAEADEEALLASIVAERAQLQAALAQR